MEMENCVVMLFPMWQLADKGITYIDLLKMKPKEKFVLLQELLDLDDDKKTTTDEFGDEVECGAEIHSLGCFQDILNDEELYYSLRKYYIIFGDERERPQLSCQF